MKDIILHPLVKIIGGVLLGSLFLLTSNFPGGKMENVVAAVVSQPSNSTDIVTRGVARCRWYDKGSYFLVNKSCIAQGVLPKPSIQKLGDALVPVIEDVTDVYAVDENQFTYNGTDLIYTTQFQGMIDDWKAGTFYEKNIVGGGYVMIPTSLLAWHYSQGRTFYAAVRDTVSTYGKCRQQNYDVTMRELNGYVLQPGKLLNLNKLIAHKPGYCTGGSSYMFYQGACGGSTQLFWNGLINPFLEVTKRESHGERYAGFYGSTFGDDASMYERGKQFELKNTSEKPLYFGTFKRPSDGNTVLLSIYPGNDTYTSMVQKQQTGKFSAVVTNTIFDEGGTIIYEKDWISNYRGISLEVDTDR